MCKDCGCGLGGDVRINGKREPDDPPGPAGLRAPTAALHGEDHDHPHPHDHPHTHSHAGEETHGGARRTLAVQQAILAKNDRLAERNRGYCKAKGLLAVNVLSAPGSGKTTFIERTVADLGGRLRVGVIAGDLETDTDAERLRARGIPTVQVSTGNLCHLEADMVARAMERLPLDGLDVLVIENVGNLVCPASYDLGEGLRVVLLSVTEGEDKPLKYPVMFRTAQVVVVNKMDLAQAVGFHREAALGNIRRVAPQATVLEVSARTGQGMADWYACLEDRRHAMPGYPARSSHAHGPA